MWERHLRGIIVFALIVLVGSTYPLQIGVAASGPEEGLNNLPSPPPNERIVADGVTEARSASSATTAQVVPAAAIMNEGFESAWPAPGWALLDDSSADGGQYLWGKRDCYPHTGSFGGWSVGGGAQGSAPACSADYPNNASTWAIYGPFDLSSAPGPSLTFYLRGSTAGAEGCPWDYAFVGSSTNGTDFFGSRYCGDWTAGSAGNGYHQLTFDLSDRAGQSQVWVAFRFFSNSSVTSAGFTIDDVMLSTTSAPTPTATTSQTPTRTATATPTATPTPTSTPSPGPSVEWRIYLPGVQRNWSPPTPTPTPTPSLTPAPNSDVPCLLVVAQKLGGGFKIIAFCVSGSTSEVQYQYGSKGEVIHFDLVIKDGQGVIIYQASIDIQWDQFGRIGSYGGAVSGSGFPAFTENITNVYDQFGKVARADVTKIYTASGDTYTMDLTPCWLGDSWSGYRVKVWGGAYNGEEFVVGSCPN